MLTKTTTCDSVTVTSHGILEVREVVAVLENGVELSRAYHRKTLAPGDDLTDADPLVRALAAAAWTPECIQAYQDRLAEPA